MSTVLSFLCGFGDQDATGIINDVIRDVALRKGVKRAMKDLAGDETYAKYVESLRVPDWVLLSFKTRARISDHTWQAVIKITQLGRTGPIFFIYLYKTTKQLRVAVHVLTSSLASLSFNFGAVTMEITGSRCLFLDYQEEMHFLKDNSTSLLFRLIFSYDGLLLTNLVFSLMEFNDKI